MNNENCSQMCCGELERVTKENVDYNKIYVYDLRVINQRELFNRYLKNRGGEQRMDSIQGHIEEIRRGLLAEGTLANLQPFYVDINTRTLIDGNCRDMAIEQIIENGELCRLSDTRIRVIYEDVPEEKFDDRVITLNSKQRSWITKDYIYNNKMNGYEGAIKLIEFCKSEPILCSRGDINPRYAAAILNMPAHGMIKKDLVITDEQIADAKEALREAQLIRMKFSEEYDANGGGWLEPYLKSWAQFRSTVLSQTTFEVYLKALSFALKNRKREFKVPYGSNKMYDWSMFFRSIMSYTYAVNPKCDSVA